MLLAPLPKRRLSEDVASILRQGILDGSLAPGQRLIEAELAEKLGVSKSPLREALRLLVAEGLVVNQPRHGSFVADFDERDFWEISTIRGALEGMAAELVAYRHNLDDIDRLEALVAAMEAADDEESLSQVHLEFHEALMVAAGHRRLLETWHNMLGQIRMFLAFTQMFYRDRKSVGAVHRPIIVALRAGDAPRARQLLVGQAELHLQGLHDMRQEHKPLRYLDENGGA